MKQKIILAVFLVFACGSIGFCQGWGSYTTTNSDILSDHVSAVAVDVYDRIYLGTTNSGLSFMQAYVWTNFTTSDSNLISNRIKALACDSNERVFIGTDVGLSMLDDSGWQTYTESNSDLTDNWIEAIVVDSYDIAWIGTHSGGLCSFDGTSWETFTVSNSGISSNRIGSLAVDGEGNIWVGTQDAGISVKSGDDWTTYDSENSLLMSDNINAIGPCPSGDLWVGTSNGLCVFRDGVWKDETSLLFDADVRAVLVDDFGFRWFGLRTGIVRFDGDSPVDYNSQLSNPYITSVAQGIRSVYFGSRDDGLLYFGYGVNLPPLMPDAPSGPAVGETDIALEFNSQSTDPEGSQLQYQFDWDDGSRSAWGSATQSHAFTSLGNYSVMVRARDAALNVSAFSKAHLVTIATGNRPPQAPTTPNGPELAYIGQTTQFSTSSYDPDGDDMEFMFDWGDGGQSDYGASSRTHVYNAEGAYSVKAKARDDRGKVSAWSAPASITVQRPNSAPSRPTDPSGPSSGVIDTQYTFMTSSQDPEGDDIYYLFDWGDGTDSGWGPSSASHAFKRIGTYEICVLAEDEYGAQSNWSGFHSIEIGGTPKPIIELGSVKSTYYLGDTIRLYGTLINDLEEMAVDVYIAAVLPGTTDLLFYPTFGTTPTPINLTLAAHSEFGPFYFFEFPIESHLPIGEYIFYGAIVSPGTQYEFLSELEMLTFDYAGDGKAY
ncbi:MAG: PKD domain-containing protein [Candidatus Coatesbacteria bacterium]|nr:PKD domain-containing protein [Candidatus Coatesbacteria bacterium]